MMSEATLQSLVAAGAALTGALIGFLGSWLAANKAARSARVQARHDRMHERRDEAISASYALTVEIYDGLLELIRSSGNKDSIASETAQLRDMATQWRHHFRRNWPWIPIQVAERNVDLVHAYSELITALEAYGDSDDAETAKIRATTKRELDEIRKTGNQHRLLQDVRDALGIRES